MVTGLQVTDASVRYGPTLAVDEVSFDVGPGEVVALLGPSGSGKSSLLRAIAGLEPLTSGTISWDGAELAGVPVHRRGFVMMFQDGQLFPHLSVAGNVGYALHRHRSVDLSKGDREHRVAELLDLVGLDGYGPRPITALSGGEAQRVALARSLAAQPRLLLLDEPLSALDRGLRERLVDVLDATLRATGTPAVYVTHDQDEAFALADRIGVLIGGRLRQLAEPSRLWQAPADREVAEFLGYGPFLGLELAHRLGWTGTPDGLIAIGPRGLVAASGGDGVPVPVVAATPHRGGTELTVTLPNGQPAGVRISDIAAHGRPPSQLCVRLDREGCAVLPDPDGDAPRLR